MFSGGKEVEHWLKMDQIKLCDKRVQSAGPENLIYHIHHWRHS